MASLREAEMPNATKVTFVVTLALLAAAPAFAAGGGRGKPHSETEEGQSQAQSTQKQTKARENAYQNALKRIPDGKPNTDPWKGAR